MNPEVEAELQSWPLSRWGGLVLLIFGLQFGLILWLSDRTPVRPRALAPIPVLQPLEAAPPEFLALNDPTWFALPHRHGFSGLAWLKVPQPEPHWFDWSNPPAWLRLPPQQTGAALYAFVRSNDFDSVVPAATPELVLTLPEPEPVPLARERSELRQEGGLAHRALLTPCALKSQPSTELLTNSVVQAVVDAKGWAQTVTLLKSSGSAQADQEALSFAARARFAPLPGSSGKTSFLTQGLLIFAWHTAPTNAAPAP